MMKKMLVLLTVVPLYCAITAAPTATSADAAPVVKPTPVVTTGYHETPAYRTWVSAIDRFTKANPELPRIQAELAATSVQDNVNRRFTMDELMSWLEEESHLELDVISHVGAKGAAQVIPTTAREQAERMNIKWQPERLLEPNYNITLGVGYLNYLYDEFSQNKDLKQSEVKALTFTAYNRGQKGALTYRRVYGTSVSRYASCILARVGQDSGERCQSRTYVQEGE